MPTRSSFEPAAIRSILPYMVIHELVAPEQITIRLAGTSVSQEYGEEVTGRNYLDFVPAERRAKASRAIFLVCEQPAGMLVRLRSVSREGKAMKRESLAFPIRDDDGQARFVYFCASPTGEQQFSEAPREELEVAVASERRFLDIGAGLPDFSD